MPYRLLVVDDHPMIVEGVVTLIGTDPDFEIVGVATKANQAIELSARLTPDLCLVDLLLPDMDGVELAIQLRKQCSNLPILIFSSAMQSGHVERVRAANLSGYLFKTAASKELLTALRAVVCGSRYFPQENRSLDAPQERLTARENEILSLIVHGKENSQIAKQLNLNLGTVKNHIHHILEKLGARQRTQASAIALSRGLVKPPET